ncbi:hypothetical protein HJC23_011677 [Cyclotella cryptica]|uniref:Protein kinase domain-containing protein n=1 Tax=Cyclotella cryptica TaxID=29204 RepID=A0ABD3QJ81_9STRA|eukprot:CCRYP_004777-RA/>CCRYP_004777-RA protein AED:0.08 eAED:0.08 QI:539/1/1/1/0.33/0/4/2143/1249
MSNNGNNNNNNKDESDNPESHQDSEGTAISTSRQCQLTVAAKTPSNSSLLPRKRNANKSPIPPGSGQSVTPASTVAATLESGGIDNHEKQDSSLNRNLHSAFDSINHCEIEETESCRDDDSNDDRQGDAATGLHEQQQQRSQSPVESRKKGKQSDSEDARRQSCELTMPRPMPHQQQTPPRIQQHPIQQLQTMQSHTPVLQSKTQQQKRYRQSSHTLFSPKPFYKDKKRGGNVTATHNAGGTEQRPPRPAGESTHSPDVSQHALPSATESMNTSTTTTGSGYDSSPATPFRFHAFPASLPRVHPRNDVADGACFSSTPFRLDESLDATQQNNEDAESNPCSSGITPRLHLRPKPPPSFVPSASSKQHLLPPLSPATRRLFDPNRDAARQILPMAPSFDAIDESAISDAVIAPSLSKDPDVSGDWSDAGMTFTNERMKMAIPSMDNFPSHITSTGGLKLDEEDEDVDTVMDDDKADSCFDTKPDENEILCEDDSKLPAEGPAAALRTKLDFNSFFSPPQSTEILRPRTGRTSDQSAIETTMHPHTPRSLVGGQFHIHNLEVSPIVRLPEDDDEGIVDGDIPMKGSLDEEESFEDEVQRQESRVQRQDFFRSSSPTTSNFNLSNDKEVDNSAASSTVFSKGSATATSASTANVNNTTIMSNVSGSTRPYTRKVRPMPDTSAFDVCTPSQQSLGSKDSGANSHKTSASDRLLCPPTPIRTPAWAHAEGRPTFQRANSLISTKVLAACPPRVLDSLSSLEDSMLENDISGSTMDPDSHPVLNSSFAPVAEKDEDDLFDDEGVEGDGCMFRPLSEKFEEQASPFNSADLATRKVTNPHVKQNDEIEETTLNKSRLSVGENSLSSSQFSFSSDFDNLGILGSGAFAVVYKVRSKRDQAFYAIKRTRRQFRGVRDRKQAMTEVQTMQRLQVAIESASASAANDKGHHSAGSHSRSTYGLYLLFFIRAWQEEGYLFCQTELCSRATCRQLRLSLTSEWTRDVLKYPSLKACLDPNEDADELDRLLPERAIWQICHDISRGLFHIHSHGMVHYDIKPSNIFFVYNVRWGTICKIGDFGLAGDIGTDDGQEGDTAYMPSELLSSCVKHPGADIFSLGLTLYEMAAAASWNLPPEGKRWHELREESHIPDLPASRSQSLVMLIRSMIRPTSNERPSAEDVSEHTDVKRASALADSFLSQYVKDVERYDALRERELESAEREARRRSSTPVAPIVNHHGTDVHRAWSTRTPTSEGHQRNFF